MTLRKGSLPFFKTKTRIDSTLLLPPVLAAGVPVKDMKTIRASLVEVTTSDWDCFHILTTHGAIIKEIIGYSGATHYSPVIHEMIEQGTLLKLR